MSQKTACPTPLRPDILSLRPNGIAAVALLGLGDPDLIALWFGETDLVTPAFIREAAKQALDEGRTFYVNSAGILPLREAIRAFHLRTCDADIAMDRITIPGSAMLGVTTALQCVVETGDNIVVVSPVWANIIQAAQICGASTRFVSLIDEWDASPPRWRLDLDALFAACDARTKAFFIASPGNPTGWIMSRDEQQAVLDFARARGIAIISDEVYGTLVYDGARHAPSFLQVAGDDDAVFVVNSFSKPWAMTGWRVGWLIHPRMLHEQIWMMSAANNTGATTFAQWGAVAALSPQGDAFRATMLARCAAGRDIVQSFLDGQNARNHRLRWIRPEGAFYGFFQVEGLSDSLGFASRLVHEARVGVAPGSAFGAEGDARIDGYLRICYAQDPELLAKGLERLGNAVGAL
jgi:aspartate/methionine/tyrosine aminotransferase